MVNTLKSVGKWLVRQRVARMIGGKRMAQLSLAIGVINAIRYARMRSHSA